MSTLLQVNDITKIYQTQPKPGLDHVSLMAKICVLMNKHIWH